MRESVCPPQRMRYSFESRCRIVQLVLAGKSPQAAAAACGASRATGYRLWRRYQDGGWAALVDRPSTPHRQPRRCSPELEQRMGPQARFVGYRSGDDLADHYAAADLFAFSSLTETFGNVVLEALASGLPVVALRAGGIGDIVQSGATGVLCAPDVTPEQFARAVTTFVDDTERNLPGAAGLGMGTLLFTGTPAELAQIEQLTGLT